MVFGAFAFLGTHQGASVLVPFLVATALAIGLVQLGALSVWDTLLAITLKVVLALAFAVALYIGARMLWRKYLSRNPQEQEDQRLEPLHLV